MAETIEDFLKEHRKDDAILHYGMAYLYWAEDYWLVYSSYTGKRLSESKSLPHALKILGKNYDQRVDVKTPSKSEVKSEKIKQGAQIETGVRRITEVHQKVTREHCHQRGATEQCRMGRLRQDFQRLQANEKD